MSKRRSAMLQRLNRLLTPPLALLLVLLSSDCAQMPPLPEGNLFITDVKTKAAYGHDIPKSVQGLPSPTVVVPFPKMDKWTCYDPQTAMNIQVYIQEMTVLAKKACQQ